MDNNYYRGAPSDNTVGQTERNTGPAGAGNQSLIAPRVNPSALAGITPSSKQIETGAFVGIIRNLEFSAGGRAHRISTGPYTKA